MSFKIKLLKENNKITLTKLLNIHLNAFKEFNFREWSYSDFNDLFNSGSEIFYYETNKKVIGFVIVNFTSDFTEIITIAVDNIYQGKNVGKALLECIANNSKFNRELFIEVSINNRKAINFYKKFGFKTISDRKEYYLVCKGKNKGTRVDALVMKYEK